MQNKPSTSDKKAAQADLKKKLVDQIRECLGLINAVCSEKEFLQFSHDFRKELTEAVSGNAHVLLSREEATSYFIWALSELPKLIEEFRPFIRMYQSERTNFWSIVTALDRASKSLRVSKTLTELFKRAAKVEPGPHRKLIDRCEPIPGNAKVVADLTEYLQGATTKLPAPEKLRAYRSIFGSVQSPEYEALKARRDLSNPTEKFLDYLVFLDFYWQSRAWIETYYTLLLSIHEFALDLGNEMAAANVYKVFFIPPYTEILNLNTVAKQKVSVFPDLHKRFAEDDLEQKREADKERQRLHRKQKSTSVVSLPGSRA